MSRPAIISYAVILATLALVGALDLATPFLTVLFSYFTLTKLQYTRSRWVAVLLFLVLVLSFFYGFAFFLRQAFIAIPNMVATAIPLIINYATEHGVEVPFSDAETLKALVVE